jgi:hypothetical protein
MELITLYMANIIALALASVAITATFRSWKARFVRLVQS